MSKNYTKDNPLKTYKVTDANLQCRGLQYIVGVEKSITDKPARCGNYGFHSCIKAIDCFNYYDFNSSNRVFECLAWGDIDIDEDDSKVSSQHIVLLRELSWYEVLDLVNTGNNCTGLGNSGDRNSGDYNSGHWNSGDWNSGDRNSGDYNSGHYNSGDRNSGDRNSGYYNSGDYNSGDYNSGHYNSGFFNSDEPEVRMFNKPTGMKRSEIKIPIIDLVLTKWVAYTDSEIEADPKKELVGGYLKTYTYKEAWANWDKTATDSQRNKIKALPNYDADIFMEIIGLDWRNK